MKSLMLCIITVCMLCVMTAAYATSPQDIYQDGLAKYNAGDTAGALSSWASVLAAKPDSDTTQTKVIVALIDTVSKLSARLDALEAKQQESIPAIGKVVDGKFVINEIVTENITVKDITLVNDKAQACGILSAKGDRAPVLMLFNPNAKDEYASLRGGSNKSDDSPGLLINTGSGTVMSTILSEGGSISVSNADDTLHYNIYPIGASSK